MRALTSTIWACFKARSLSLPSDIMRMYSVRSLTARSSPLSASFMLSAFPGTLEIVGAMQQSCYGTIWLTFCFEFSIGLTHFTAQGIGPKLKEKWIDEYFERTDWEHCFEWVSAVEWTFSNCTNNNWGIQLHLRLVILSAVVYQTHFIYSAINKDNRYFMLSQYAWSIFVNVIIVNCYDYRFSWIILIEFIYFSLDVSNTLIGFHNLLGFESTFACARFRQQKVFFSPFLSTLQSGCSRKALQR